MMETLPPQPAAFIARLPSELAERIMKELSPADALALACTCSNLHSAFLGAKSALMAARARAIVRDGLEVFEQWQPKYLGLEGEKAVSYICSGFMQTAGIPPLPPLAVRTGQQIHAVGDQKRWMEIVRHRHWEEHASDDGSGSDGEWDFEFEWEENEHTERDTDAWLEAETEGEMGDARMWTWLGQIWGDRVAWYTDSPHDGASTSLARRALTKSAHVVTAEMSYDFRYALGGERPIGGALHAVFMSKEASERFVEAAERRVPSADCTFSIRTVAAATSEAEEEEESDSDSEAGSGAEEEAEEERGSESESDIDEEA